MGSRDKRSRENRSREKRSAGKRSAGKFALALLLAGVAFLAPAQAQQNVEKAERQLFDAISQYRASQGLPELKKDARLTDAARKHASLLAAKGTLSHQLPMEASLSGRASQAGVRYRSLAENVAQGPDARNLCQQWIHSPPHRANLLDSDMDSMGIGIAERDGTFFAVADLAQTLR
jgi:uncharacterized protein YkwD